MKRLLLFLLFAASFAANAQSRGVKIGYIDMEYILQNVPDYTEAKNQLEQKAQKWKQEIETKKNDINKLKDALKTERVLLTKELIDEREEEIRFQETELSDYQQKRFGPTGDLMIQKAVLVKPIQDQVFTAAQDIAEAKKYDFIFDKSSDMTMLFAAKRFDISDQVVRAITRASKRDQMTKKQLKEEEAKEAREELGEDNPAMAERQKVLDEKKQAREKLIADRKAANEEKKRLAEEKRKQLAAEKEAKRNGTAVPAPATPSDDKPSTDKTTSEDNKTATDSTVVDPKKAAADAKAKEREDRKKALEERKAKILADREAAKKAKEEKNEDKKQE
ncbi:MAG: OmpH family outer membrane protein [Flavobacterium sp.]|nr:MAG: OmpH family outer membrane protein [Flavobacterium sp.]